MKMDLLDDNNNNINLKSFQFYIPYIKILYEGLEAEALKTYVGNELYSAQLLSEEQVQCLVQSKKNRVTNDLPMSILYSKSFLSFSKVKSEAENFMNNKNAMLTVIKSENKYDLLTHADIEDISDFKKEREVLFFPLSVFGIDDFIFDESNNRYELKLIYLGKYIKDFEKDEQLRKLDEKIPDSNFKTFFLRNWIYERKY